MLSNKSILPKPSIESSIATSSIESSIAESSNNTPKDYKQKCYYGVLYGKIVSDTISGNKESVFLKKVCNTQNDAVDFIQNFVKDHIVRKNGIEFYNKLAFSCSIIDDFKNQPDGVYIIKNNNSWSVYKVFTKINKGYGYSLGFGTYAEQQIQHLYNLYISKENHGYMVIEKDRVSYNSVMNELKLKIQE